MAEIEYLDFDLQIEAADQGYRARVLDSPAGQASNDFLLPFSDLELENFVLRMSRTRRGVRRLGTPELEAARTFGGRLFEAVFAGEVRGALRSSLDVASRDRRGLRLRVRLSDAPGLVDLPWEFLYSAALNRFFSLSNTTPVIRYLDLPERISPLAVQPPLRLLAMIAGPHDYPPLDVEQEWRKLRSALQELEEAGLVILERLHPPTLGALQRRLRQGPCHILHFVGHGAFDEAAQDGMLLLEDEQGRGRAISAQDLGVLLHDHPSLRLVMLNSCEGARTSRLDPFAGSAQSLVQQGIPAVIAMQFEISDEAAIVISHEFYAALAAGYPVDAALAEARKAAFTSGSSAEWGIPVLYLRAADGRIFGLTSPAPSPAPAQAAPPAAAEPVRAGPPPVVAGPVPAHRAAVETATTDRPAGPARGTRRWVLPVAGLLAVLVLVVALARFLPPVLRGPAGARQGDENGLGAATAAVTPAAGNAVATSTAGVAVSSAGPALDKLLATTPRVFSNTGWNHDLAPAADGVWAASNGGLVRWHPDGTNSVFTTSDGLPFNHTRALLAMPDGSLWAAGAYAAAHITLDGDSLGQVRTYAESNGLPLSESPSLMLDDDGSVWISSFYSPSPIYRFNGTVWRPPELPAAADDPALQNLEPQITTMLRGQDGAFWVGLEKGGILRLRDGTWTHFGVEQGVPEQRIGRLLQDSAEVLWAAAGEGGLLRFDTEAERWESVELPRADAPVFWISQLPDDSLWASGDNFIVRSTDGGQGWEPVTSSADDLYYPSAVVQDGAGRVWAATGGGVAMYDEGQWSTWQRPEDLTDENLGHLVEAPDGKLWVVPEWGGPPSTVDLATGQVESVSELAEFRVYDLAFHDGATWAGTSDGLLRLKDGFRRRLGPADGLPAAEVNALLAMSGTLWIGTADGLASLDLQTEEITGTVEALAGNAVDAMLLAPDGALWVGSHSADDESQMALDRFLGTQHRRWSSDELPVGSDGQWVRALAADDDGGIWVSLSNGVQRWDGSTWTGWSGAEGGPTNDINAFLGHGGEMWAAGGPSYGIYRWNSENGWQRMRAVGATGAIAAMRVTRDGALWLATGDGLLRYGP